MPDKVVDIPGVGPVAFPDTMNDEAISAAAGKLYADAQRSPGRLIPETLERMPPLPNSGESQSTGVFQRMASNYARNVLPSTTPSDYVEGPMYAVQHPIDSLGLLGGAIKDAHLDQAAKTREAAGRVFSTPGVLGKLAAASETVGHGVATALPFFGPAAAHLGEQLAEGDIAGGVAGTAGLLTPFAVRPAVKATAPIRSAVADRVNASATGQMETALAATTNENKVRAARIAPEMVKRRIWNKDLQALESRADVESTKAGKAIESELAKVADKEVDVLPLVDELEKAKAGYVDTSKTGNRIVIEPAAVEAVNKLQSTLMEYGDTVSIESINKVRKLWDQAVQRGKGFTADEVSQWNVWAKREGRTVLREELSKASPDIDRVMAEYAFWQSVEDVAHATNKRRVGQSGNLTPTIAGAGGAVVAEALMPGSGVAAKVGAGMIGAKLAASLRRALSSPGYQMWSAVQKGRLADALSAGDALKIEAALKAGAAAPSAVPSRAFPVGPNGAQDPQRRGPGLLAGRP